VGLDDGVEQAAREPTRAALRTSAPATRSLRAVVLFTMFPL